MLSGQLAEGSVRVKTARGTETVPVADILSYGEGVLWIKDPSMIDGKSVIRGEITNQTLSVVSKYGKFMLPSRDLAWFGVGKPPDKIAEAFKRGSTGSDPASTPQPGIPGNKVECERSVNEAMRVLTEAKVYRPGRVTFVDDVMFTKIDEARRWGESLLKVFKNWEECVDWSKKVISRLRQ